MARTIREPAIARETLDELGHLVNERPHDVDEYEGLLSVHARGFAPRGRRLQAATRLLESLTTLANDFERNLKQHRERFGD
jgi:hypothetical protein